MRKININFNIKKVKFIFDIYLLTHFTYLLFWAEEIFPEFLKKINPFTTSHYGSIPNVIRYISATNTCIYALISIAIVFSFANILRARSYFYLTIWYVWYCLADLNQMIINPSTAYVSWMLLAFALLEYTDYRVKAHLRKGALFIFSLTYTVSGFAKLNTESWIQGRSIFEMFDFILVYNSFAREILIALPKPMLEILTYLILGSELFAFFFILVPRLRFLSWTILTLLQLGCLLLFKFTDLSVAMLIFHLFVYDQKLFFIGKYFRFIQRRA